MIYSHAPVASLGPLLAIHLLGYSLEQAADEYISFKSSETMGRLSEITFGSNRFFFYDHSHRASILNYHSALKDLASLKPRGRGRKIAILGHMMNLGNYSVRAHENLSHFIEASGIERLYTVGKYITPLHKKLHDNSILIAHGDNYKEIEDKVISDIKDGDLVFIKGHHRIWLNKLAKKIYELGECREIR
jgi:UDP-N-acetylmuramoyl-tripeptide--D-alanyl-D-alanine ligase